MTPELVAASYDQITRQSLDVSTYGCAQIEPAIAAERHASACVETLARKLEVGDLTRCRCLLHGEGRDRR